MYHAIHNTQEFTPDFSSLAFLSRAIQSTKYYVRNYQQKCKTNLILSAVVGLQMNLSILSKMTYQNKSNWTLGENKPNQSQF